MDSANGITVTNVSLACCIVACLWTSIHTECYGQDIQAPLNFPLSLMETSAAPRLNSAELLDRDRSESIAGSDNSDESEESMDESADDESSESDETESTDLEGATLLGDRFHRIGPVTANYLYNGQAYNNSRGGISTKNATRYRGNLDVILSLDTGTANWWQGGTFNAYLQSSHGRTLTREFVGDAQFYSNLDTSPKDADLTQLGEYWYRHSLGDDRFLVKLGLQDPNVDFAFADLGGDFVNSSFLTLPNIPLPTWPTQSLGVSSLFQVSDKLRVGGGVYDQGRDIGQWWTTFINRGTFLISQADYQPFASLEGSRLTVIRFGSWFSSSDTVSLDGNSVFQDNYGFFSTVDRMLITESQDSTQGLGGFFQFSWAPSDRNQLTRNYGAGLVYRGLLPGRDGDTLGLGFSLVEFSSVVRDATGQTSENAVELFYKARLRNWLSLQPDFQYIARPNGIERDAFLVGLNFEVAF